MRRRRYCRGVSRVIAGRAKSCFPRHMTEDDLMMELAIFEAGNCQPRNPRQEPKVGAVIAIDGKVVATAHRGPDDHAEKVALAKVGGGVNLSRATVYTTLEPCTHEVRRGTLESCRERLIAAHVKRVVIGILDPNQGVCGKGILRLQEHQIEVGLFPDEKAQRIRQMNEDFIPCSTKPRDKDHRSCTQPESTQVTGELILRRR